MATPRLPYDMRGRQLVLAIGRDRYERWLARETHDVLEAAYRRTAQAIPRGRPRDARSAEFQRSLRAAIRGHLREGYAEAGASAAASLTDFARLERDVAADTLASAFLLSTDGRQALVSRTLLRAVAEVDIQGMRLGEWWETQAAQSAARVTRQVQVGMLAGETPQEIARRVWNDGRGKVPSAWAAGRRDATTVVRTAVTAVSVDAAHATYAAAGPDASGGYEYLTARDYRVSDICRPLDGRRYSYTDPDAPRPPMHLNCRSTIMPVINWKAAGYMPPGAGSPLTHQSYADWLRAESPEVQDALVGRAAARGFREGRVSLDDLLRADGRRKSVADLRRDYGLDPDPTATGRTVEAGLPSRFAIPARSPRAPAPPPLRALPSSPLVDEVADATKEFERALAAERAGGMTDVLAARDAARDAVMTGRATTRALVDFADAEERAAAALATHNDRLTRALTVRDPASVRASVQAAFSKATPVTPAQQALVEAEVAAARDHVERLLSQRAVGERPLRPIVVEIVPSQSRAIYDVDSGMILVGTDVHRSSLAHEMMHAIEAQTSRLDEAAHLYLDLRAGPAAKAKKMTKLSPGRGYGAKEKSTPDAFLDPYLGKRYEGGRHTELLSMGVEMLMTDPEGFRQADPDMFHWLLRVLRGGYE